MNKRIIICGPTCSGKNFLRQKFVNKGFSHDVSYTTRQPREGEFDGIDYHFLCTDDFNEMIKKNKLYEYVQYGYTYYGTGLIEWNSKDIFIMETKGISKISEEYRKNCLVIFINPSTSVRINRMKNIRSWTSKECHERIIIDEKNFKNFFDYDMLITNSDF